MGICAPTWRLAQSGARAVTDRASWFSPRVVYAASRSSCALELAPYLTSRVNCPANKLGGSVARRRSAPSVAACDTEISAMRPRRRIREPRISAWKFSMNPTLLTRRMFGSLGVPRINVTHPGLLPWMAAPTPLLEAKGPRENRDGFKGTLAEYELFLKSFSEMAPRPGCARSDAMDARQRRGCESRSEHAWDRMV